MRNDSQAFQFGIAFALLFLVLLSLNAYAMH